VTYAFAAAGTGGHLYPALAVADALVAEGVARDEIVFFGGDRMEAETVPAAGYRFCGVEIRGLRRSLSPANLALPRLVLRAARRIADEMSGAGTRVVTVFGGYVSIPAGLAARRVGAHLFLHEQNAAPGLANRLLSGRTRTSFVAFPAAARRLRNAAVVGNPLRPALAGFDRDALAPAARMRYDLPEGVVTLGVLGGSLGARVLNEVTARIADDVDPELVAIVHLTGSAHHESVAAEAADSAVAWRTVPFEREMEHFYAAADLVLGRAGALTVSELAATGTPAVVVPLAAVSQEGNAAYLAERGGVVVVPEANIDQVPVEIEQLLVDAPRRERMAKANLALAMPHAAGEMARRLITEAHRD
jgi:UDP-N-acetylglucosamine--N-acetylmuramyl-(pentapeptide) pyrophosphoryl-undecaprenol N-acetylglucosamine transferase